jgi:hypothetical protein
MLEELKKGIKNIFNNLIFIYYITIYLIVNKYYLGVCGGVGGV